MSTPYARSAALYADMGWSPVPCTKHGEKSKGKPLEGYTGHGGRVVTPEWAAQLAQTHGLNGHSNVAVRAVGVVGIDVDAYDGRGGAQTLAAAEEALGKLPATVFSTARGPGESGIRWYRLPEGVDGSSLRVSDLGDYGSNVEIIRWGHRYAFVWPSPHPTAGQYRWYTADGALYDEDDVPDASGLPMLPQEWLDYLSSHNANSAWSTDGLDHADEDPAGRSIFAPAVVRQLGEPIHDGDHDASLTSYAAKLRANGFSRPDAYTFIELRAMDCRPAWGSGLVEVRKKVDSAWRNVAPPCDCDDNPFCSRLHTARVEAVVLERMARPFVDPPPVVPIVVLEEEREGWEPWHLPEEFWNARPLLAHLRQAAWSARIPPEGVLLTALALILYYVEPNAKLSPVVGGVASLNLMAVAIGEPGSGKSTGMDVVERALDFGLDAKRFHEDEMGSGQGIPVGYQHRVGGGKGQPVEYVTDRTSVFWLAGEGTGLKAAAEMKSQKVTSNLCKFYMGEAINNSVAGVTGSRLERHSYRGSLMVYTQPLVTDWIFEHEGVGFPQRFLWTSQYDRRPRIDVEHPGKFEIRLPLEVTPDPMTELPRREVIMHGSDAMVAETKRIHDYNASLEYGEQRLDAHSNLTRRKIAAALALVDGRLHDNEEDWDLAGIWIERSDAARDWVKELIAAERRAAAVRAAQARASDSMSERTAALSFDAAVDRVLEKIKQAGEAGVSVSELRKAMTASHRGHVDGALAFLEASGKIQGAESQNTRGPKTMKWLCHAP